MPKFYDSHLPTPTDPSQGDTLPPSEETVDSGETVGEIYEEFDISSFDFTIADPWETEEEDPLKEDSAAQEGSVETDSVEEISAEEISSKEVYAQETEQFSENLSEPEGEWISESKPQGEPEADEESEVDSFPKEPVSAPRRQKKPPSEPVVQRMKRRGKALIRTLQEKKSKLPEEPLTIPTETKEFLRTKVKRYLRYALRPAALYENLPETFWSLFLGGSSLFMGVFYLLVGMDWHRASLISSGRLWAFVAVGLVVGATAALAFAGGTQILSLIIRKEPLRPFRVLSSVAGATVFPATILLTGLLLELFGVATSMAFGVIALLWWIFVLMEVLRDLFGPRYVPIVTVLSIWAFALFAVISATFSLK